MTAQENIAKLPSECYGVLKTSKELIKIKAGEMGYYKIGQWYPKREVESGKTIDQVCYELNNDEGVTPAQRAAMEWGSQFGWETPLANPDNFNEAGNPIKERLSS